MDVKQTIDSMSAWLDDTFPDIAPRKVVGCYRAAADTDALTEAAHLKWMIEEMRTMTDVEKLMRWIGFMQGALWSLGYVSIDEFRKMNTA